MNKKDMSGMNWQNIVMKYSKPNVAKSIWQIVNSFIPYLVLLFFMYKSLSVSYWLTFGLGLLAVGFSVRIFIIFHDCAHGSFFKSNKWNTWVGMLLGLVSYTPFYKWKRSHDAHHKTVGNLDKRGIGDVKTLTVEEFANLPKGKKLFYKLYRNPIVMFLIGGLYVFLIQNRFTSKKYGTKEFLNTHLTTLVVAAILLTLCFLIGFKEVLIIQLSLLAISSTFGVSLFYIQHQYEDVTWLRNEEWDYKTMAIEGSSYFKLPKILQWFTGNIGIHHIHHLSPKIPNYNLQKCLDENPEFQIEPITINNSFKSLKLRLWDEKENRLVGFKDYRLKGSSGKQGG